MVLTNVIQQSDSDVEFCSFQTVFPLFPLRRGRCYEFCHATFVCDYPLVESGMLHWRFSVKEIKQAKFEC